MEKYKGGKTTKKERGVNYNQAVWEKIKMYMNSRHQIKRKKWRKKEQKGSIVQLPSQHGRKMK